MRRAIPFAALALAALMCGAGPAQAGGGLSVSPVSLTFAADGRPQALEVSNPGDAATEVQVRLFAWTLAEGQDHLEPSGDLGFSPPMFGLEPGASQVIRLAPMTPAGDREAAYRLLVDQLPSEPVPGRLQMPVRMSLPLFVSGTGGAAPARELAWRVAFDPASKRARLTASNPGGRRVKVMELAYTDGDNSRSIASGLSGYVLAGAARSWDFDYAGPARPLEVKLLLDGEPRTVRAELVGS